MIGLHRCRQILGSNVSVSDDEIAQIREALYALAHIAVDVYAKHPQKTPVPDFEVALRQLRPDARDDIEERAAILEHNGGCDRGFAERHALGATCLA